MMIISALVTLLSVFQKIGYAFYFILSQCVEYSMYLGLGLRYYVYPIVQHRRVYYNSRVISLFLDNLILDPLRLCQLLGYPLCWFSCSWPLYAVLPSKFVHKMVLWFIIIAPKQEFSAWYNNVLGRLQSRSLAWNQLELYSKTLFDLLDVVKLLGNYTGRLDNALNNLETEIEREYRVEHTIWTIISTITGIQLTDKIEKAAIPALTTVDDYVSYLKLIEINAPRPEINTIRALLKCGTRLTSRGVNYHTNDTLASYINMLLSAGLKTEEFDAQTRRLNGVLPKFNIYQYGHEKFIELSKHDAKHTFNTNFHSTIASSRTATKHAIEDYVKLLGLHCYWVGADNDKHGYLNRYCSKDFKAKLKHDIVESKDVFCFSDTDNHVDMNYFMSLGHPIICTGTILTVEKPNLPNHFHYPVSSNSTANVVLGGSTYIDQPYNYSKEDHFLVSSPDGEKLYYYDVDYRITPWDNSRYIAMMTPHTVDEGNIEYYDSPPKMYLNFVKKLKFLAVEVGNKVYYAFRIIRTEGQYVYFGNSDYSKIVPIHYTALTDTHVGNIHEDLDNSILEKRMLQSEVRLMVNLLKSVDTSKLDTVYFNDYVSYGEQYSTVDKLKTLCNTQANKNAALFEQIIKSEKSVKNQLKKRSKQENSQAKETLKKLTSDTVDRVNSECDTSSEDNSVELCQPRDVTYNFGPVNEKVNSYVSEDSDTAVVPDTKSLENVQAGIVGRVTSQNKLTDVPIQHETVKHLTEYVNDIYRSIIPYANEFLQKHKKRLRPLSLDKMTQRELVNDNLKKKTIDYLNSGFVRLENIRMKAMSFIKLEGYNEIKDARMITKMDDKYFVNLCRFTVPVKLQILKKQDWYGPGLNAQEMGIVISHKMKNSKRLYATDYSRFDGSQAVLLRKLLEERFYTQNYTGPNREYLEHLFFLDYTSTVTSITERNAVSYPSNATRLSGSGLTTDGNSVNNAGSFYIACRVAGATQSEAMKALEDSFFYGDDGLMSLEGDGYSIDEQLFVQAIATLGLNLKIELVTKYAPVCSRFYDENGNSVPDLKRAAPKLFLHYTQDTRSPKQQIFDRILGYHMADPEHPYFKVAFEHFCVPWLNNSDVRKFSNTPHEIIVKLNQGQFKSENDKLLSYSLAQIGITSIQDIEETLMNAGGPIVKTF